MKAFSTIPCNPWLLHHIPSLFNTNMAKTQQPAYSHLLKLYKSVYYGNYKVRLSSRQQGHFYNWVNNADNVTSIMGIKVNSLQNIQSYCSGEPEWC